MNIGFFDTGLGGATILREVYKYLNGNFVYLADTKNSPYGIKDFETVKYFTELGVKQLISLDCKIIIIACNTATSAAIQYLRLKYKNILFIGAEPAIKPALENCNGKKVLLTATSLTLKGAKLFTLLTNLNGINQCSLLPLDELVEFADASSKIRYDLAEHYLRNKFINYDLNEYSGIVLGCTHFPIFKDLIRSILPSHIKIYDSAEGITNNLKRNIEKLYQNEICTEKNIELILTEEIPSFKNKFYNFIHT